MVEDRFRRDNVVVTVFGDLGPHLLRHRLIPGKTEFLVMDTQFDLPLLETLLLGREIVDIGIRDVVRLSEERVATVAVDNLLRKLVQLLV